MFMLLPDEEALDLEHEIRNLLPKEIVDVATLKRILRDGLGGFEELLKELSSHDREAALSLYLQKMRDVAFRFHLAVLKMTLKDRHQRFSTREEMQACLKRSQQDLENVARLYQVL
jgi:hypothetical protein